ncbi:transposase [Legionella anisa]|uniref:Transposase n=1 Tax=Legionella anisa TaxID=28082 RepID=A0AAX0WRH8_9GAMM|nr:transposase [Legionella anisa]PNL60897.1 transposase [Legionella anisa]
MLEKVESDLSDYSFIKSYRDGLSKSSTFRDQQFPEGDYGSFGRTKKELITLFENIAPSTLASPNATEFLKKAFLLLI